MFDEKMYMKFSKLPTRRLIGGRYLVEIESAYFHNKYVGVEDMNTGKTAYTWLAGTFHDKSRKGKSAEDLYMYLSTAKRCKDFLDGKIVRVSNKSLPSENEKWGKNILFDTHM